MDKLELIDKIVELASDNSFDGFNESCMDRDTAKLLEDYDIVNKNDNLPVVSQQRELLKAYFEWEEKQDVNIESYQKSYLIDEYLDSL